VRRALSPTCLLAVTESAVVALSLRLSIWCAADGGQSPGVSVTADAAAASEMTATAAHGRLSAGCPGQYHQ
jgi:hypothetical protein